MKNTLRPWTALAAFVFALSACSNLERSRDMGNPNISGTTMAQQVCANCHGQDGNSKSPKFPKLAAQQKDYLIKQLSNFKGHERSDPLAPELMWGMSRHLSTSQIEELSEYFSRQSFVSPSTPFSASLSEGQLIYEEGIPTQFAPPCMSCHGKDAQGMGVFPRLQGQHQDYLMKQLLVFSETDLRPNTPMTQVTHQLSREQMKSVAHYLSSMPIAAQGR